MERIIRTSEIISIFFTPIQDRSIDDNRRVDVIRRKCY